MFCFLSYDRVFAISHDEITHCQAGAIYDVTQALYFTRGKVFAIFARTKCACAKWSFITLSKVLFFLSQETVKREKKK